MRNVLRATLVASLSIALIAPATTVAAKPSKAAIQVPMFVEEAAAAGVEHTYDGNWEYFVGGGVAAFDCDDDGRPELYFAGGETAAALFHNRSPKRGPLRFEQIEDEATDMTAVIGAYPLDIDADGHTDVAVLRHGQNVLLRGLGECGFERANEAWAFDGGDDWSTAFSATWEDGRTWPTLAFGSYIDHIDEQHLAHCGQGSLYRPVASGDAFEPPTPLAPGQCALSMLFSDWDRSGRRDLRVTNDRHYYYQEGGEQLWQMSPAAPPQLYGQEDGWKPVQIFGMGIASQDLTGDDFPEFYLASIGSNRLETLAEDESVPAFEDIAFHRGISATTPSIGRPINPSTSWHPEFDDVNNDGRMDLFVSKGNIDDDPTSAMKDPNELFLGLPDGSFRRAEKRAGIMNTGRTRGAALVDLNRDGLLDLVEVNRYENVNLRRNIGRGTTKKPKAMGHWLGVKLQQQGPNHDAVGAWVEVEAGTQRTAREITVGGGHAGGALGPTHFGLGNKAEARIRVTWPDGYQGRWWVLPADAVVTIDRADDEVEAEEPEPS